MNEYLFGSRRYYLFICNCLFWVFGTIALAYGIWILADNQSFIDIPRSDVDISSEKYVRLFGTVVVAVGSIIFVVSFLGCGGAILKNQCLLGFFLALLMLVLGACLGIALFAVYFDTHNIWLRQVLDAEANDFVAQNATNQTGLLHYASVELKCCGIESRDVCNQAYPGFNCSLGSPNCATGCWRGLSQYVNELRTTVVGLMGVSGIVALMNFLVGACLCCSIKPVYRRYR